MSSNSASTSSPSSSNSTFITNDMFLGFGMEIEPSFQAVFKAQEKLHQSSEERQEEVMQQWMEMRWEERMSEWDLVVVVVNTQLARMAGEKVVVEIWKRWYSVNVRFLYFGIWIYDCHFVGFE